MALNRTEVVGYLGMGLLQFNSIPAIIEAVHTGNSAPIATMALTIAGLACYLYNSVKTKNTLYTVGNVIGIIGNSILIIAVLSR